MSTARISGKRFSVEQDGKWEFETRPGGWVIARRKRTDGDGNVSEERVRLAYAERRTHWWANAAGTSLYGEWIPETRGGGAADTGDADLTAQFPGKVRKVLVKPGQSVQEGESLVLVEAMKMEFAIKAPHDGKIEAVHVSDGQQLSPGDRFVDLKASSDGNSNGKKT